MGKKKLFFLAAGLLTTFLLAALLCRDLQQPQLFSEQRLLLGTLIKIQLSASARKEARQALTAAFAELERIESAMNFFGEGSELTCLNQRAGIHPVKADEELYRLIEKAQEFSQLTSGAFDITATSLKKTGGYLGVVLDPERRTVGFTNPQTRIDLGGIAKGYAVDRAITVLSGRGIKNFLVDAGGDIGVRGGRGKGVPWRVAIRHPADPEKFLGILELENQAVASSGNYLRPHIIEPATGLPAASVLSVTVLAEDCLTADALATAVFVLGREKGLELIEKIKGAEALVAIAGRGKVETYCSSGFPFKEVERRE